MNTSTSIDIQGWSNIYMNTYTSIDI